MGLTYRQFFRKATGIEKADPYPYQERLADGKELPALLDIPTGLGKTLAVVLAWLWRRRFAEEAAVRNATPRRLVYCLPMRVLVEQTFRLVVECLRWLGLLTDEPDEHNNGWSGPDGDHGCAPVAVHLLLGGEGKSDWALWPERDAILIGTQDMLISRALNRGYAAGRARWPLEFGLLNNDCLWVFDEIQLMDTGLATSLQFDAWRRSLRLRSSRTDFPLPKSDHAARPCHSLWMSATMARHWLESAVDFSANDGVKKAWEGQRVELGNHSFSDGTARDDHDAERVQGLFKNSKELVKEPIATLNVPRGKDSKPDVNRYINELAQAVEQHKSVDGLTLVIVNTVDRARELYQALPEQGREDGTIRLIHSRFRPYERNQWKTFLRNEPGTQRIIISTQVVEAGIDISAKVLFTELAPWTSLVQRFGRCARFVSLDNDGTMRSEHGTVYWMNLPDHDLTVLPYTRRELAAARSILQRPEVNDVGLKSLSSLRDALGEEAAKLFPYEPRFVPRDKDLFDLFDTTPDLTGADVDISRYIRDDEELDVQVFWRDLADGKKPGAKDRPLRDELCSVPFLQFRKFLKAVKGSKIWRQHYRNGWEPIDSWHEEQVYPGQVFWLKNSCGGYSKLLGWTGVPANVDTQLPTDSGKAEPIVAENDGDESDDLSQINRWLTIEQHTRDVCKRLDVLLGSSELDDAERKVLRLVGRLHDWGKCHPVFQAKLDQKKLAAAKQSGELQGEFAAKAPDGKNRNTGKVDETKNAWRTDKIRPQPAATPVDQKDERRPGFRHELASALAVLETLYDARPAHETFAWPDGLNKSDFSNGPTAHATTDSADNRLTNELAALSTDELDLLIYLVAAHHGKVRMSLRSSSDDDRTDVPDPCPENKRQARGVRDDDELAACRIPAADVNASDVAPKVILSLDLMELGLSPRFGPSWRERTQLLLERLGPFRLAYLESLLRAADCRASADEDQAVTAPEKET